MSANLKQLIPDSTSGRLRAGALALSVLLLALVPVFVSVGLFTPLFALNMAGALFFAVFAMSWDMASGYTGEISFGHALFFAVGGYTAGMLNVHSGVDPLLAIPAGAIAAAVAGLLIGYPSLRLEGPYFSLITLVVPLILLRIFILFPDWTGGGRGLIAADTPTSVQKLTYEPIMIYLWAFGLFMLALILFLIITRSNTGEILTAIRENPDAVAAAGLNPSKYKLFAFVISGLIGGLAGALFIFTYGSATPGSLLGLVISIEVIVAAVLGGIGTITGAALGGIVFYLLRDFLTRVEFMVPVVNHGVSEMAFLIFGIVTLLFLFFLPMGIVRAFWMLVGRVLGDRGAEAKAIADGGTTTARSVLASFRNRLDDILGGENE